MLIKKAVLFCIMFKEGEIPWNRKQINIPEKNENLAEFIGIMLGDGNIYVNEKYKAYQVKIVGDFYKDFIYLNNYVKKLIINNFSISPIFYKRKRDNGLDIKLNSINLVKSLLDLGLKSGDKIKNQVTIPDWIYKKEKYLVSCIRGLFDTDGSVYELLPNWPGLFQITFTNKNMTLLQDTRKALLKLKIKVSNISNLNSKDSTPRIYITKKEEIKKFLRKVGFSNPKHLNKLKSEIL